MELPAEVLIHNEQLGMKDLAESTRRVLVENYPNAEPPPEVKKKWFYFF